MRYPDSHQLFVGNLPHDIDEGELKDFFMSECSVILTPLLFLLKEYKFVGKLHLCLEFVYVFLLCSIRQCY